MMTSRTNVSIYIILIGFSIINATYGQNKYAACCGAESVDYIHSDMSIYVPNVFTPNKDSVNDLFFPHLSGKVVEVIDFTIYTSVGDTVLFYRPTIVYNRLDNYGWNGLREGFKEPYIGAFRYTMKIVNIQGDTKLIEGRACRLDCDTDADKLKEKVGCYFPDQVGVNGKVDKTKKTKEKKCK